MGVGKMGKEGEVGGGRGGSTFGLGGLRPARGGVRLGAGAQSILQCTPRPISAAALALAETTFQGIFQSRGAPCRLQQVTRDAGSTITQIADTYVIVSRRIFDVGVGAGSPASF